MICTTQFDWLSKNSAMNCPRRKIIHLFPAGQKRNTSKPPGPRVWKGLMEYDHFPVCVSADDVCHDNVMYKYKMYCVLFLYSPPSVVNPDLWLLSGETLGPRKQTQFVQFAWSKWRFTLPTEPLRSWEKCISDFSWHSNLILQHNVNTTGMQTDG